MIWFWSSLKKEEIKNSVCMEKVIGQTNKSKAKEDTKSKGK